VIFTDTSPYTNYSLINPTQINANNYHLDVDLKYILIDNHSQRNAVPNLRLQGRYVGRKPSLFR